MPNQPIQTAEIKAVRRLLRRKGDGVSRGEIAEELGTTPRRVAQIIERTGAKVVRVIGRTMFFKEPRA